MSSHAFRRVHAVERRANLSRAEFERTYLEPSLPVVLPDAYHADALARWTEELTFSPATVGCVVARRGNVAEISDAERPDVSAAARHPDTNEFFVELPLAEIVLRMRAPGSLPPLVAPGETLYVFSVPWPADLASPRPAARGGEGMAQLLFADPRPAQLLVNGPGMLNRAHAHIHSYFLQQLHGTKHVRLFSPAETPRLYHNGRRRSYVEDFDVIDEARFPRVAEAEAWEATLEPGEALFLPTFWWHEIRVDQLAVSMGTHAPPSPLLRAASDFQRALAAALEAAGAGGSLARPVAGLVLAATAHELDASPLEEVAEHLRYTFDDPR